MKKTLFGAAVLATLVGGAVITSQTVYGHGYVKSPVSRAYQGSLDKNDLGWATAFDRYGAVISNPQSLEAPKGFPESGPSDGRIASANGGSGQIGDFVLDQQGTNRWKKQDINSGMNTFTWTYTATHRTSKWHYYITKNGWNPDAPIKRSDLQLIGTVQGNGAQANTNLSHQINVPTDHKGYHVILAVWDVADTSNAFYQVIDVNIKNSSSTPLKPTVPTGLKTENVTTSTAKLSWNAQTDAVSYDIYRDDVKVATVNAPEFMDKNLKEATNYIYQIVARSSNGLESMKSDKLSVKTLSSSIGERPTVPTGLHSMGETSSTVDLMWSTSSHTQGIKGYQIFRDGKKISEVSETHYKDKNLTSNTEYRYTVKSISKNGEISESSNELSVKTKRTETPGQPGKDTWEAKKIYLAGEVVIYGGKTYRAKYWTQNNRPDTSAAWEQVVEQNSDGSVDYVPGKAYVSGNIVKYKGKNFQAKWWTTSIPGSDSSWKIIQQ